MDQDLNKKPESPEQKSKTRELLLEWGFDVQTFEARARRSMEGTRGDMDEVTGALRQTLNTTKQTLIDLHTARQPVAAELKSGFERAWDEIEKAFGNVRRQVRETREARETASAAGANKSSDDPLT